MAYYDALVAAWNGATQPPAGVTGTALTGLTTSQKISAVNGWTVAGPAQPMLVPTYRIYNAIVPAEFQALTAGNQQLIRDILGMGTVDVGTGTNVRAVLLQVFGAGTQTRTNLVAIAASYDAPTISWCQKNGYPFGGANGALNLNDAAAAGVS
jgi:hypothetical protein